MAHLTPITKVRCEPLSTVDEVPLLRFFPFRRPSHEEEAARSLYRAIVRQARAPAFFGALGVPDTAEGRFETLALHAFLVLRRLKGEGRAGAGLAQALFDLMFAEIDVSLRELGVGDLGVGRKVRALAEGFYGRIRAYELGLAAEDATVLSAALRRNLYGVAGAAAAPEALDRVAGYVRREAAALAAAPLGALAAGEVRFGPPPEP
ncbi:MAG: ubiquinol-cytochrome C chaperone [Proteobacteria bacterium]|nr:ubiquinol-cytochrome C chaperone [Pseudomonadota bacterium]